MTTHRHAPSPHARSSRSSLPRAGARPAPAGQRYPLEGKVVEVDVASRTVTIAHGDIPGFMPAMTMPFVVLEKDAALLQHVGPGDEITATLVARSTRATGSRTSWS